MNSLRQLPSVDKLLQRCADAITRYGRDAVREAIRKVLDDTRTALQKGVSYQEDGLIGHIYDTLAAQFSPSLRPLINATGVIIHTNLGRAPLSHEAQQAILGVAQNYNTLEFDLATGKRGSRYVHAEQALCELTGAEAALVVNNTAAALVLLLSALAIGKKVVLSRGHLVEIGGGFRVPDIMAQSGAYLTEVGTTNRTRGRDYAQAIDANTALLMAVHSSNFKQIGFVEETPLDEIAQMAHEARIFAVHDLGSGALLDTAQYGLTHEPTVQESVLADIDIIAFSGDKLLGGPQSGILVGKQDLIARLKEHPLARAVRADKLFYAGLSATLDAYRRGEATTQIPIWQMIAMPLATIDARAQAWAQAVGGTVVDGSSTVGGGSLPGDTLPTKLLSLAPLHPQATLEALRRLPMPIIARIEQDRVLFDPRTVFVEQDVVLLEGIRAVQ